MPTDYTAHAVSAHHRVHSHAARTTKQLMEVDLARAMRTHPDAVAQANAIYHVTVDGAGSWTVDTTVPKGRDYVGLRGHSDCDFEVGDDTLHRLIDRTLSPEDAYFQGLLHVSNIPAALKLATIIRAIPK